MNSLELYRPNYHFTPPKMWMNDPNGMFYYKGTYHLFYQYYPKDIVWGPMHWGHTTSNDLIHWQHQPIALYPDELGYIFSGSAVVDWKNTSGLGTKETPPLIAIFTYHDAEAEKNGSFIHETQAIAYSLDAGDTWIKYEQNPVLKNPGIKDFRDPKVFWHQETEKWIMSLAVKDRIDFYSSPNLINWKKLSDFGTDKGAHGGVWECPDLFPLTDENGITKWVLFVSINPGGPQKGSATQYFLGDFDGTNFTPDDDTIKWIDWGPDNYAGVTYSDIPKEDGRRLFIGWMSNWLYAQEVPTTTFRSAMTIPRELILTSNSQGYFIQSKPIEELENLVIDSTIIQGKSHQLKSDSCRIIIQGISQDFKINLSNSINEKVIIGFENNLLFIDRSNSCKQFFHNEFNTNHQANFPIDNLNSLTIFLDNSSVEAFVNEGGLAMTSLLFPQEPFTQISIDGEYESGSISYLKNIWSS